MQFLAHSYLFYVECLDLCIYVCPHVAKCLQVMAKCLQVSSRELRMAHCPVWVLGLLLDQCV